MYYPLQSHQAFILSLKILAMVAKTGVKLKQGMALESFDFDLYCVRNSDLHFILVHETQTTLPHGLDI